MHKIYQAIVMGAVTVSLLLGNWRGHVALFIDGDEAPIELYPVRLELLPPADQDLLREGIPISGPDELGRILEDLLS